MNVNLSPASVDNRLLVKYFLRDMQMVSASQLDSCFVSFSTASSHTEPPPPKIYSTNSTSWDILWLSAHVPPSEPPPPCSNMAHHKSTSWDILGMCCHPGFPSYLHPVIMGSGICWKGGAGVEHGNRAGVFLYFESVPLVGKTSLAGPEIVLRIWLHYVTVTWEPTWKPADQPTLSKETTIIFQKKMSRNFYIGELHIFFTISR